MKKKNEGIEAKNIKGKISFKDVSFGYEGKKNVIEKVNIEIPAGKKVAFFGESGSGKSTLVSLIERFYKANEGEILIDDENINNYNVESLRNSIGYVPQEPILFNSSLRENIFFGRESLLKSIYGTKSESEILSEVSHEAYCSEFIERLSEKFEFIAGVQGGRLSGGQKQRIALARALLLKPKIIILDEATSALDAESSKEVLGAIENINKKEITTVMVTHKVEEVKSADIIYVIKEGKVAEKGTHEELIEKNGVYKEMISNEREIEKNEENKENEGKLAKKKRTSLGEILLENPTLSKEESTVKVNKWRLFELISDHKYSLILATFGSFLYGSGSPLTGETKGRAINSLSNKNAAVVFKEGLKSGILFFFIAGLGMLAMFLKIWKFAELGSLISLKLRKAVLKKYLSLHVGYYDFPHNSPGALLTRLSTDTANVHNLILSVFGSLISSIGTLLFGIISSIYHNCSLALVYLVFIPFMILSETLSAGYKHGSNESDRQAEIKSGSFLSECVLNSKTVFAFNFTVKAQKMYSSILEMQFPQFLRNSLFRGFLAFIGSVGSFGGRIASVVFSLKLMKERSLSFDEMNYVVNILSTMESGVAVCLSGVSDYKKAKIAFRSLFRILDTKSQICPFEEKNEENEKYIKNEENLNSPPLKGKIEFRNVSFSYPSKPDKKVLKNVSFTIEPGSSVVFVGFSGSGKSTIFELIERFYDVESGEILIDGKNIKEYNLLELRKKIGIVAQENVVFKRSIRDNILYGNLHASEEDIISASKSAKIYSIYKTHKDSYFSLISGGEKQRISLARIFIRNFNILLLDEYNSALDKKNGDEIFEEIKKKKEKKKFTLILISHSLHVNSDFSDFDSVFEVKEGNVRKLEK